MKRDIAGQKISAKMLTLADGTAYTGAVSVFVDIDGATQAAGLGTVVHKGNGVHEYSPTQAETDGAFISFSFVGTATIDPTIQVYTSFPQSVDNNTILATLPASIATIDSNVDAIIADTNELQLNQGDWLTATGFATTAEIANVPTVAEFNARTLLAANYFDFTTDSVKLSTTQPSITFQPMTITASGASSNITLSGSGTGSGLEFSRSGTSDLFSAIWTGAMESVVWDANIASYVSVGTAGETLLDTLPTSGYTAPDNASIASILVDTNELQTNQGNWLTATGFSTFNPASDNVSVDRVLGTTLVETTTTNIADNLSTFFDNADSDTAKVVDDVGTAVSGGGEFTATEKNQLRYRLGLDGASSAPSATPDLSTQASINALNDFNPTTDTVAHVTLVDTTTDLTNGGGGSGLSPQETRDAMKLAPSVGAPDAGSIDAALDNIEADTSELQTNQGNWLTATGFSTFDGDLSSLATAANLATVDSNVDAILLDTSELQSNQGNWTTATGFSTFNPSTDTVARVTLVDTTTTNSDMKGTNNALLDADYVAPNNSGITSIIASISDLNDLSFDDIWTGQLTESYAIAGQAPTPTQALMMNQQFFTDFSINTTNYSVKGLDGVTTVGTFTLDDDTNPTSIERAS